MSSQAAETEGSSTTESKTDYSIEFSYYDELVMMLEYAKLDYYVEHISLQAVTKTLFKYRNIPAAFRATTNVRKVDRDGKEVRDGIQVTLTDLELEEESCRREMREAETKGRALESQIKELVKERRNAVGETRRRIRPDIERWNDRYKGC